MNKQSISKHVRGVIAGLGTFLLTLSETQPPPSAAKQTTKVIIGVERAKQIFLLAAQDVGIPSAGAYPDVKGRPLADAMAATWNFALRVFNDYPAELAEGVDLSIAELVDWQAQALSAAGWVVTKTENGEGLMLRHAGAGKN